MDFEVFGYIADSFFLPLALVVLLVIAAAQDLKTKEVSGWLTLFPLLVAVTWRTATGAWILLAAFVTIALFSERIVCKSRGLSLAAIGTGLVAIFCFLPGSPSYWTLLGWLAAWLLWEFNVIGGADVKLMMLLVTVYPDPRMLFLILLAKLVAGFIVPAALYGRRVARRLFSAAFLVLVARQMPDRETLEREGLPAVFVYTMAGVAYVLVFAPQCAPRKETLALPCGVELGDPITWGFLALAFTIGTVPIALFLRSVPSKIPWTAGRPAGLHSPQSGRLDQAVDCTGRSIPPLAGLRSVPSSTGLPAVRQNGHAGLCRHMQPTHTAQIREE